jgi:MoxR-like ATPase
MDVGEVQSRLGRIRSKVGEVVVGNDDVVETLIVALLSGGHVLLEGPPGIGKTTLAKTFAQAVGGEFKRIQMTPDLLPSDVLGVNVYNQRDSTWSLRRGPIFANVVLVDELNRASPKVQSAFLEVMQERQVTIEGQTLPLGNPFMVIATQVSFARAGTYVLSDVQIDRFAFKVDMTYPPRGAEEEILRRIDSIEAPHISPVLSAEEVVELSKQVLDIRVHERVHGYILDLVAWLRGNPNVREGPSTRASVWLLKGARARAMLEGREYVNPDDVKFLAYWVLGHRLDFTPQALAEEVSVGGLIKAALDAVPVPKGLD